MRGARERAGMGRRVGDGVKADDVSLIERIVANHCSGDAGISRTCLSVE